MKVLTLYRLPSTEQGTNSVLVDEDGSPICNILERPWKDNMPQISSIPIGEYLITRVTHPKFGETFKVENVIGRDGIYFHKANLYTELHGCLAFGEGYVEINGVTGVSNSGAAKERFLSKMTGHDQAKLVILNYRGGLNV